MKNLKSLLFLIAVAIIYGQHIMAQESASSDFPENLISTNRRLAIIDGTLARNVNDTKFNLYITDIDKEITENDLAGTINVENNHFYYETEIDMIKAGRLRGTLVGNKSNSLRINFYLIPGFTIKMIVDNDGYEIENLSQYNFLCNAWLNRDNLLYLLGASGQDSGSKFTFRPSVDENLKKLERTIAFYHKMQYDLRVQIENLKTVPGLEQKKLQEVAEKIISINSKIEELIEQYANTIVFK